MSRTFVSGRYYTGMNHGADTTVALTQGTEMAIRFEVGEVARFDRIGIEVTTHASGAQIRLGVRRDTGDCQPGSLIGLYGSVVSAAATAYVETPIELELQPGRCWLTATLQAATGVSVRARNIDPFLGQTTTATNNASALTATGRTGALPDEFGSTTVSQTAPKILLRAA